MQEFDTPVVDSHLHLDPDHGRGLEAVKDFARSDGMHLLVVSKPSQLLGHEVETGEDFRLVFETTVEVVRETSELLPGRAWPVLGVHPGLVSKLVDDRDYDPETTRDLVCAGLDTAVEFVREGGALALKSGHPHYEVTDAVWGASNAVLRHGLDLAADCDRALQLHTESTTDLPDVAEWADERGVSGKRVIKHYVQGHLTGDTPSVMSDKDRLEDAAERSDSFFVGTDLIDGPDRPGAMMGSKTVPRRVDWLLGAGRDDTVRNAHIETPTPVYGIGTKATLDRQLGEADRLTREAGRPPRLTHEPNRAVSLHIVAPHGYRQDKRGI